MCYSSGSPLRLPLVSSEAVLGAEGGLSVKVRFDRCAFPTRSLPRRASLCPGRISDTTFLPSFLLLLPSFLSLAQDHYAFQLGREEQGEALLMPQIPCPA